MPIEAAVFLRKFRYLSPATGKRVSPYIWPFLASISSRSNPPGFDFKTQTFGDARVVIMENMSSAHTPDIPTSEGVLLTQFQQDDLPERAVLLVVALWEKLDTPDKAVKAAFEAFSSELSLRFGHRITALKQAFDENNQGEINLLIKEIEAYVRKVIDSAIRRNLSAWEKVKNLCRLDAN